jgi:hypothetical protein
MTIRQYIRRRWIIRTGFTGVLIAAALLRPHLHPLRQHLVFALYCAAAIVTFVVAQSTAMQSTRCLRCTIALRSAATQAAFGVGKHANACPHCGAPSSSGPTISPRRR